MKTKFYSMWRVRRVHMSRPIGAQCLILLALCMNMGCAEIEQASRQAVAKTQPPVEVQLPPYLILKGYFVRVANTSATATLEGVSVTYTGSSGNQKTQTIGTLKPGEAKTLDPAEVGWRVAKHESISVSATGYVPKTLQTNVLIDQ